MKAFILVGVGWVICFIYWMVMMILVRSLILKTMERVKNPMEYSGMTQERSRSFRFS